jgi:hypothetical protein
VPIPSREEARKRGARWRNPGKQRDRGCSTRGIDIGKNSPNSSCSTSSKEYLAAKKPSANNVRQIANKWTSPLHDDMLRSEDEKLALQMGAEALVDMVDPSRHVLEVADPLVLSWQVFARDVWPRYRWTGGYNACWKGSHWM